MDDLLKKYLEKTFILNKAPTSEPQVLAAMITAAAKMAKCSNYTSEEVVVDEILDLYQKTEDMEVASLIGMSPQNVEQFIGYPVNFKDYKSVIIAYENDEEYYDKIYYGILKRSEDRSQKPHL